MVLKAIFAIILPFFLVLLFTRVSYNHYVGTALTAALIIASHARGYTGSIYILLIDFLSLLAGFFYARKMKKQLIKKK